MAYGIVYKTLTSLSLPFCFALVTLRRGAAFGQIPGITIENPYSAYGPIKTISILWPKRPTMLYVVPGYAVRHGFDDVSPASGIGYEDPFGPFPGIE